MGPSSRLGIRVLSLYGPKPHGLDARHGRTDMKDSTELQAALRGDVERLASSGTRRVGTSGHDQARDYLLGRLTGLGLTPYRGKTFSLPYRSGRQDFENLVGV